MKPIIIPKTAFTSPILRAPLDDSYLSGSLKLSKVRAYIPIPLIDTFTDTNEPLLILGPAHLDKIKLESSLFLGPFGSHNTKFIELVQQFNRLDLSTVFSVDYMGLLGRDQLRLRIPIAPVPTFEFESERHGALGSTGIHFPNFHRLLERGGSLLCQTSDYLVKVGGEL